MFGVRPVTYNTVYVIILYSLKETITNLLKAICTKIAQLIVIVKDNT